MEYNTNGEYNKFKTNPTPIHACRSSIILLKLPFVARITVTATSAQNPLILLDFYSLIAVTQFLHAYLKLLQDYARELSQEENYIRV